MDRIAPEKMCCILTLWDTWGGIFTVFSGAAHLFLTTTYYAHKMKYALRDDYPPGDSSAEKDQAAIQEELHSWSKNHPTTGEDTS